MKRFFWALFIFFFVFFAQPVAAKYDPRSVPNNRFGIHVAASHDVAETAALVNSTGGDWGYVTVVIQEDDRDLKKWQAMFDQMRRLHLIPIVRIATHVEQAAWVIPAEDSAKLWTTFLASLNWPVENRYVVIFNEPNHAKEWGNTIDPEGYARTLRRFAATLNESSEDFFILPAGLDVSARSDALSLDAIEFWRRMYERDPEIFSLIDGWTSHAYPNPGFSGSPAASGRGTVRSFSWELSAVSGLGVDSDLPVFITETGWVHQEGKSFDGGLLSSSGVGAHLAAAAQGAWADQRVVAVTPFIYDYQDVPFDHFSFKRLGTSEFYEQYYAYQRLAKIKGEPQQRHDFTLETPLLPTQLVAGSTYTFEAPLSNSGQSILTENDFQPELIFDGAEILFEPLPYLEPNDKGTIRVHLQTSSKPGSYLVAVVLNHFGEKLPLETSTIELVPPPSLSVTIQLGWRFANNANDVTVLVYDENEQLLHKFTGRELKDGTVRVDGLTNIVPGREYRVVGLVPDYLPRQKIVALGTQETAVKLPRFYPLDFNGDGALTASDISAFLRLSPQVVLRRLFGP